VRLGEEEAVKNPGIAISVDVAIHLFAIHGAFVFAVATIALTTSKFLVVFAFAVIGVLLWVFPGVAFVFF
jgi:Flp pilus assembly protein TadB